MQRQGSSNGQSITICLGSEHDERLRKALVDVLRSMGAVLHGEGFSGVGGSQEVEIVHVEIGGRPLCIEAETFIGLSVVGEAGLVEEVAMRVRARLVLA